MIIQKFIWQNSNNLYKYMKESDISMIALAYFLDDGLPVGSYLKFLEDNSRKTFSGNISWLEKKDNLVSIEMDDYVYPDTPIFTTSVSNLLYIIKEYNRLEDLEVDRIEISVDDNDKVSIKGE